MEFVAQLLGAVYLVISAPRLVGIGPMFQALAQPQVLIGWVSALVLILLVSTIEPIGPSVVRFCWGFLFTSITTYFAFAINGAARTGVFAGLSDSIFMAFSLWAGLALGGPSQVLVAKLRLFGQTDEPRPKRRIPSPARF